MRVRLSQFVVLCIVGLVFTPASDGRAQEAPLGSWAGALEVGGTELRLVFHIERGDDGLAATMDSPDQGATGIPVSSVTVDGDSLTLAVDRIGGVYEGALSADGTEADGTEIEGTWTQGGRSFPLTLTRVTDEDTAPRRVPSIRSRPIRTWRKTSPFRIRAPGLHWPAPSRVPRVKAHTQP